jgi:catechol 2,3-dioxygenase-like lactoylglutathione lyase family enzyme
MIVIESINHVTITVSDLEKSILFYKDIFDFEVIEKYSDSGQAFIRMGDILILLNEIKKYQADENSKNSISFYIDEEDFDDAIEEIKELKLEIVYGPENLRKGRSLIFIDPDGNRIELSYPKI